MNREPFIVHCDRCHHEWAPGFCPMPLERAGKVLKRPCPACGSRQVLVGPFPNPTPRGDIEAWLENGDTGVSSETIWYALHRGRARPDGHGGRWVDVPHDSADFGRCYRLLQVMPSWRARLHEVLAFCPAWAPFVAAWDELTWLYEAELHTGRAPKLYARMQELKLRPVNAPKGTVVAGGV